MRRFHPFGQPQTFPAMHSSPSSSLQNVDPQGVPLVTDSTWQGSVWLRSPIVSRSRWLPRARISSLICWYNWKREGLERGKGGGDYLALVDVAISGELDSIVGQETVVGITENIGSGTSKRQNRLAFKFPTISPKIPRL